MKHSKLSNKLTLDKKLFVLMITFTVAVMNISITNVVAEEPIRPSVRIAPDGTIDINGNEDSDDEATTADECEKINDDLNEKLREMNQACSATSFRGNCLEALLSCDQNMSGPESCDALKDTLGAISTEDYKDQVKSEKDRLEKLEDRKAELLKLKSDEQEKLDKMNSEIADRKMKRQDLEKDLKDSLRDSDQATANTINGIRAQAGELQTRRDAVFSQLMDQRRQIGEFMLKEQLTCNQSAREEAKEFYTYLRMCSEGRKQGCNLSLQSLVVNGNSSYSAMANKFKRQKAKECMRTDSSSDFAIKHRAFMSQIDLNKDILNATNKSINDKATELNRAIQVADAQGKLANTELTIQANKSINAHEEETQRLMNRALMINGNLNAYDRELASAESSVKLQEDVIDELKTGSSGTSGEELANLRNAHMDAESLISEAQEAQAQCGCTSEIQRISDRSGLNFCDSGTAEPADVPVFDDGAI